MKTSIERRRYPDSYAPPPPRERGEIVAAKGLSVIDGDTRDRDGSTSSARLFEIALRGLVVGLGFLVGSALVVMAAKIVLANLRAQ